MKDNSAEDLEPEEAYETPTGEDDERPLGPVTPTFPGSLTSEYDYADKCLALPDCQQKYLPQPDDQTSAAVQTSPDVALGIAVAAVVAGKAVNMARSVVEGVTSLFTGGTKKPGNKENDDVPENPTPIADPVTCSRRLIESSNTTRTRVTEGLLSEINAPSKSSTA